MREGNRQWLIDFLKTHCLNEDYTFSDLFYQYYSEQEFESIDEYIPEKFRDELTAKGSLMLLPNTTEGHDGFFITRFRRKK